MFGKIMLVITMLFLTYLFWLSDELSEMTAGIAIFLFGMIFIKKWFSSFTGWLLEKILQKATDKAYKWMLFGFFAANMLQSSSLVTVITIGFLSAELIWLTQAIAIIFWSSVGTTTTAWLIAAIWFKVNIWAYAFPCIVFGMIWSMQKSKVLKWLGSVFAGIGFVFLGIHFMKNGFESFQSLIDLSVFAVEGYPWVLLFTAIGIFICILMQSSTATIALVITAVAMKQIQFENALALVIGANIGTTITWILASLSANINGKRLALADFSFKTTTAIICIIFFPILVWVVNNIGDFFAIQAENYTLRVALFHTLFNLIWVVVLSPFIGKISKIATSIIQDKKEYSPVEFHYISKESLAFPDTAIQSIKKESLRMYGIAFDVFALIFWLKKTDIETANFSKGSIRILPEDEIDSIYDEKIKVLYSHILTVLIDTELQQGQDVYSSLQKLKHINRSLVSSIKNIENMSPSFTRYLRSSNTSIRQEYENIIDDILQVLHISHKISISKDPAETLELFAHMQRLIEQKDITKNSHYSKLVGEKKINHTMATALLNDTHLKNTILGYIFEIHKYFYMEETQKKAALDSGELQNTNKWIQAFQDIPKDDTESILETLQKKQWNIQKKLEKKDVSKKSRKKYQEKLKDVEYALMHYHNLLKK